LNWSTMATVADPVFRFFSAVVADLKTSRRFQVCLFLWLPLIVTSLVAVVRLGLKNTDAKLFPEWKTEFIPESSGISFPDVTIGFLNPDTANGNPSFNYFGCSQRGIFAPYQSCPSGVPVSQCRVAKLSAFQASRSEVGQNHVTCNITILSTPGVNQEIAISMLQGYVWFPNPPTYINPNAAVEVDLFRELFIPIGQGQVFEWSTLRNYESSVFNSNPSPTAPFAMSLTFRIPFRAVIVHRQFVAFDDFQLLAAWGGFFTFMAFLHAIVFWFVKLYTVPDSKILANSGGEMAGPSYEPIK